MTNLKKCFATAKKVVKRNPVLVCLEGALIKDGWLTVSNLETTYSFKVPTEATCLIDFKFLYDLFNSTKEFPAIEVGPDYKIKVGNSTITGMNPEDFPAFPENPTEVGPLSEPDVKKIQSCVPFCSKDEIRQAMMCIFVGTNSMGKQCAATDAHKLRYLPVDTDMNCLIPAKVANLLFPGIVTNYRELKETQDGQKYNANYVQVATDSEKLIFRPIEAKYPDYPSVIPTDQPITVAVNRNELLKALVKLEPCQNKVTRQVKCTLNGKFSMHSEDPDLAIEGNEAIDYKVKCSVERLNNDVAFQISFNGQFMTMILKSETTETVELKMNLPNKPITVNDSNLIMPIMSNY